MFNFHFSFQKCDDRGRYWGSKDYFDIAVIAKDYNSALAKAKAACNCEYVRDIICSAVEIPGNADDAAT